MKTVLPIEIECGKTTCASEPGAFCRFVGSRAFGTQPLCTLFPDTEDHPYTRLCEIDGWLQRCPVCLAALASVEQLLALDDERDAALARAERLEKVLVSVSCLLNEGPDVEHDGLAPAGSWRRAANAEIRAALEEEQ